MSNYETNTVQIWLDNEQSSYSEMQDLTRQYHHNVKKLADAIQSYVEELNPIASDDNGIFADLLNAALREVEWREIAGDYIAEYDAEHDTDDPEPDGDECLRCGNFTLDSDGYCSTCETFTEDDNALCDLVWEADTRRIIIVYSFDFDYYVADFQDTNTYEQYSAS